MFFFSVFGGTKPPPLGEYTAFPILYVLRHLIFCEFSMKTHPSREWLRGCLTKSKTHKMKKIKEFQFLGLHKVWEYCMLLRGGLVAFRRKIFLNTLNTIVPNNEEV